MKKLIRLGIALALVVPTMTLAALQANAHVGPADVSINCNTDENAPGMIHVNSDITPVPATVPSVVIPSPTVPILGGTEVLGSTQPCADLTRTLVFVGVAQISNGVNFNGTGMNRQSGGPLGQSPNTNPGGHYTFPVGPNNTQGICVLVDWTNPAKSNVPDSTLSSCEFKPGSGTYTGGSATFSPIFNGVFGTGGANIGALNFDPDGQASCFTSSGSGTQGFKARGTLSNHEDWDSSDASGAAGNFSWENSLSNLRGHIHGTNVDTSASLGTYEFDAKIEAHADPSAAVEASDPEVINAGQSPTARVVDSTDAGCLDRPLYDLSNGTVNLSGTAANTGLNYIMVAGTSTWESRVERVFGR